MTLETQRLILRKWQKIDVGDLFDIMKNSSVVMGGWKPHSNIKITSDVLNGYIESDDRWAVALKDGEKVIGYIRVCPDNNRGKFYAKSINYVLSEDYWGKGYMTEAVKRIVKYLFEELNVDLLSAFHYPDNVKSKKVLEKCGFEYEITIEQGCKRFDGKVFDAVCYSILKSNYMENKLQSAIRSMEEKDRSQVLEMMRVFYASPAVLTNGSQEIFEADVNACVSDNQYLEGYIFENAEEIQGYAMVAKSFSTEFGKPCIWIEDIYLKNEYRGLGIGSLFLEFIEGKYPGAILRLEVEEENERAVNVYKKCGYEVIPYMEMKK